MEFVWTYIVGAVAANLPQRWRARVPMAERVRWGAAATVSALLEGIGAIVGLGYWYMFEMTRRMGQIIEVGNVGGTEGGLSEHQIQGAALTLFYMSPLTWLLFYLFFEGMVRMSAAAFTGGVYGMLPLWVVERMWFVVRRPEEAHVGEKVREHARLVAEVAENVRERVMVAQLDEVPDELEFSKSGEQEFLEIRTSRRKPEWEPPKIVRVNEAFYRLEESVTEKRGPRPFVYRLRRLEAGVMSRKVIVYKCP